MRIRVVLAGHDRQYIRDLDLPEGAIVSDALRESRLLAETAEAGSPAPVGIFGKIASRDTLLREGDRVEIYRPLQADPKELRRKKLRVPR